MSVAAETAASEQDWLYIHSSPLRTAAGFVLGTVLSGALWTVAGVLAWYLI
jgi:hypothetical protein